MRLRVPRHGVDLDGAVVVLTGASSGIGRTAARRFAARGAPLVLASRDRQHGRRATHRAQQVGLGRVGADVRRGHPRQRRVARAIVRCATYPRREAGVGQLHHLASWGHALRPRTYSELAPLAMRFVAIGDDRLPHDSGNVFAPQPDLDGVRGGWRKRTARVAVGASALAAAAAGATAAQRWAAGR